MRKEIIWTIIALVLDAIAISLIWVCANLTIPPIAAVITTMICCVAGCGTFNIVETWINRVSNEVKVKERRNNKIAKRSNNNSRKPKQIDG